MAFNNQGQWLEASWSSFKKWTTAQLPDIDARLHLLRFRSAIARRRLTSLLNQLPPVFDQNAQQESCAIPNSDGTGTDSIPVFQDEWKPQDIEGLGGTIIPPNQKPKSATGVSVQNVKSNFYRELRCIEYMEHRIQKMRIEIEKIEAEIYWLECAGSRVATNLATVDAQFSDPTFTESLLKTGSNRRLSMFAPYSAAYGQKFREGEILLKQYLQQTGTVIPDNKPNASSVGDITGEDMDVRKTR